MGSVWDRVGVGLGSVWDQFGGGSGSIWGRFGKFGGVIRKHAEEFGETLNLPIDYFVDISEDGSKSTPTAKPTPKTVRGFAAHGRPR